MSNCFMILYTHNNSIGIVFLFLIVKYDGKLKLLTVKNVNEQKTLTQKGNVIKK